MIRKSSLVCGIIAVSCLSFLNSCNDDDEPPKAGVSFELKEQEVTESDGTVESIHPELAEDIGVGRVIEAKLVFDRELAREAVIKFDIDGTARENASASAQELNDFEIEETGNNVTVNGSSITVAKGAKEASFSIRIFEDFTTEFEEDSPTNDDGVPYETVVITLESVTSGPVTLGEQVEHTVKILEDDAFVFLEWDGTDATSDMNLYIYLNNRMFNWSDNTEGNFEGAIIPAGFTNGTFGMSYVYKSGSDSENLDFAVGVLNLGGSITKTDGTQAAEFVFESTYTPANINSAVINTESSTVSTKIVQTMVKEGLNYKSLSEIEVPQTSSRIKSKQSLSKAVLLERIKSLNKNSLRSPLRLN
ncbi:hypothetical protein [Chryseosolibacter indicus]|uniref:Calx-beta domain-containing protein n=1 Tax=Chryseosolibacter indicus TaxID=2782351 RepID=A0ABS5VW95_9BACT|nr:hypothetical protein [Chryseosolibacter indicus]MBT1705693.1 hypothetical protein [Chryseosolibacter indicus]